MIMLKGLKALAGLTALAVVAVGCGDDDADSNTEDAAASDYCELAKTLDEQDDFPTAAQLEALQEAAPDEIKDEVAIVVPKFLEGIEAGDPGAAYSDPAVEEAFGPIEDYEGDVCGLEQDDEPDQDPAVTELDPAATRIGVTATEYEFELDTAPVAGHTSIVMTNAGQERHVMFLFRIDDGATFDQVMDSQGDEGVAEDFESETAAKGEEAVLTVDLVPGNYGMICYLPNADGKSHDSLGMTKEFTVA